MNCPLVFTTNELMTSWLRTALMNRNLDLLMGIQMKLMVRCLNLFFLFHFNRKIYIEVFSKILSYGRIEKRGDEKKIMLFQLIYNFYRG